MSQQVRYFHCVRLCYDIGKILSSIIYHVSQTLIIYKYHSQNYHALWLKQGEGFSFNTKMTLAYCHGFIGCHTTWFQFITCSHLQSWSFADCFCDAVLCECFSDSFLFGAQSLHFLQSSLVRQVERLHLVLHLVAERRPC